MLFMVMPYGSEIEGTAAILVEVAINTEPPKFNEELKTIFVRIDDNITYTLPSVSDADGDSHTL